MNWNIYIIKWNIPRFSNTEQLIAILALKYSKSRAVVERRKIIANTINFVQSQDVTT